MKRPLIITPIIGLLVAASIGALHASGILRPVERLIADLISREATINRVAIDLWQYLLVVVFSFGVAAFTLTSVHRARSAWLALAMLIELAALAWICSLAPTGAFVIKCLLDARGILRVCERSRSGDGPYWTDSCARSGLEDSCSVRRPRSRS